MTVLSALDVAPVWHGTSHAQALSTMGRLADALELLGSPLAVAEQFGTLESLHPGRIDLGVVGGHRSVRPKVAGRVRATRADGLMALTLTPDSEARLTSYVLLAEARCRPTSRDQLHHPGVACAQHPWRLR